MDRLATYDFILVISSNHWPMLTFPRQTAISEENSKKYHICVVSAVLRVVFGGNGNLMVQLDFIILNSRPRMHVQNQRT